MYKSIAGGGRRIAILQTATILLLIPLAILVGSCQPAGRLIKATCPVAVVQGNINIDMQKTVHRYTLEELLERYLKMLEQLPSKLRIPENVSRDAGQTKSRSTPTLCLFTESAVPAYLRQSPELGMLFSSLARDRNFDIVVGALDRDESGPYNSAYGFTSKGRRTGEVYHKRYLVPFGEYAPTLVQYMPEWVRRLTNTPAGKGLSSGVSPEILKLTSGKVAPLICFECISPELASESCKAGGELLVNVSDLAWFHRSAIGEQMIAFSVFRAIENRRFFVFAANTGPSAIIDQTGRILRRSSIDNTMVLEGKVGFISTVTPFAAWFH